MGAPRRGGESRSAAGGGSSREARVAPAAPLPGPAQTWAPVTVAACRELHRSDAGCVPTFGRGGGPTGSARSNPTTTARSSAPFGRTATRSPAPGRSLPRVCAMAVRSAPPVSTTGPSMGSTCAPYGSTSSGSTRWEQSTQGCSATCRRSAPNQARSCALGRLAHPMVRRRGEAGSAGSPGERPSISSPTGYDGPTRKGSPSTSRLGV